MGVLHLEVPLPNFVDGRVDDEFEDERGKDAAYHRRGDSLPHVGPSAGGPHDRDQPDEHRRHGHELGTQPLCCAFHDRRLEIGERSQAIGKEPAYAVAETQIYASHYLQTALDLSVCVKDSQRTGFYIITVKGSKQAGLTGLKGSIVRKVAVDKTRSSLERVLVTIKQELESQHTQRD